MRIFLTLAIFFSAAVIAAEDVKLTPQERLPIVAWYGIPNEHISLENFRAMAEAGFTVDWWAWYPDADAMQKALDLAKEAHLSMIGGCPELEKEPEKIAKRFAKHPALLGYALRDEPSVKDIPDLGKWAARLQAVDKKKLTYVNLFPNVASADQLGGGGYPDYIKHYLADFPAQFISFDHYPGSSRTYDTQWYDNLAVVSQASRESKKPMWAFVLSCGVDAWKPTLASMRQEAYTDLAFGAQVMQYFTFWTAYDPRCNLGDGPMLKDGKRGPLYDLVKTLNQEITALWPVFEKSKILDIGTANVAVPGVTAYKPRSPVAELKSEGRGALVALHANQKREFLVVVNRNNDAAMALDLKFDGKRAISTVDKQATLHALADNKAAQIKVDPGDVAIFCWDAP